MEEVLHGIESMLMDGSRMLALIGDIDVNQVKIKLVQAKELANKLSEGNSSNRIEILKRIISRITVQTHNLTITFFTHAIWSIKESSDKPVTTSIKLPVQLKRCGMAMKLIVEPSGIPEKRKPDKKIIALITKAHQWFAKLTSGQYTSIKDAAQQENVSRSYFTRTVYISFLDPFIVQKILQGSHPIELNADRLKKSVPLPLDWNEQRALLGITS